ncbi:hypothetical protein MKW94_016611 [Papaver nudicaule]|uniref:Uncharacterized protein n=1 Tax=Papaver nudicaule TaxID=74823 RepID=A0AA41RV90_PAPNU|nr:hypothetical protein [Papaver nudicaule]
MEEEILLTLSMASNTTTTLSLKGVVGGDQGCSDSNISNSLRGSKKRKRQFKGVLQQPNGHWGAQLYTDRKRTWIGTFETEAEAAKAYDRVAFMLKSEEDLHQNYPLTSLEADFLKLLTVEQVMNMFKDESYETKFKEFAANSCSSKQQDNKVPGGSSLSHKAVTYQQLFHKQLTLSDVGKLNRLVIPRRYAEAYLPPVSTEEKKEAGVPDDIPLPVYDREMNCWNFRYCFWKSSQSYVFTRGWIQFVKGKKLKAGDVVTFYWCECREDQKAFYMIDVTSNGVDAASGGGCSAENRVDLQLGIGRVPINEGGASDKTIQLLQNKEDNVITEAGQVKQPQEEKKTFRLFGVNIS